MIFYFALKITSYRDIQPFLTAQFCDTRPFFILGNHNNDTSNNDDNDCGEILKNCKQQQHHLLIIGLKETESNQVYNAVSSVIDRTLVHFLKVKPSWILKIQIKLEIPGIENGGLLNDVRTPN